MSPTVAAGPTYTRPEARDLYVTGAIVAADGGRTAI
jgi:hypothetical protein